MAGLPVTAPPLSEWHENHLAGPHGWDYSQLEWNPCPELNHTTQCLSRISPACISHPMCIPPPRPKQQHPPKAACHRLNDGLAVLQGATECASSSWQ